MSELVEHAKELARKYSRRRKAPNALEKGPRHYAAEICALPESQQAEAFQKVPAHLCAWVSEYVNDPYAEQRIINSVAASIAKLTSRENRNAALAKVPEMFRPRVKAAATAMIEWRKIRSPQTQLDDVDLPCPAQNPNAVENALASMREALKAMTPVNCTSGAVERFFHSNEPK